ncbi:MAG: carbonic anhydrase [Candidatus Omnitrophica bacterium]|jgi:carbonic anhydrase|nr:carbonic anhydrase [Candidatus Omnitrophota bacterium]
MKTLLAVDKVKDIPKTYKNTPIGRLFEYHNLGRPYEVYTQAQMLVGMCMDNRKHLRMPDNFAFIIRTAGANLRYGEFKVSYAIGVGGAAHIALIGHTQCGMVGVATRKKAFVEGLMKRAGWEREQAEEHFSTFCMMHDIGDVQTFILSEVYRLRMKYPKIKIAPMIYRVEDNRLYLIREK